MRTILIILLAVGVAVASRFIFPTSQPVVHVAPERLFDLFPGFAFTNSLLTMLIVDVIVIGIAFFATRNMQLVPRGLQNVMEAILEALYNLFKNISPRFINVAWPLVATIFLWVLVSNWIGLIPGGSYTGLCVPGDPEAARIAMVSEGPNAGSIRMVPGAEGSDDAKKYGCSEGTSFVSFIRSPSTDLNFSLGLGLISFVFFTYWAFRTLGIGYLKKFFNLDGIMSFVGIIEFISELVKPIALGLRLFGNIFAGKVLVTVMAFLVPLVLPMPIYAFELFIGFIQALVFALLTMAFLSIATTSHEGEHHGKDSEQSFDPAFTKTPPELKGAAHGD
jgi:F-type H+-transporting ATPase subunit a